MEVILNHDDAKILEQVLFSIAENARRFVAAARTHKITDILANVYEANDHIPDDAPAPIQAEGDGRQPGQSAGTGHVVARRSSSQMMLINPAP